jgi:hypothetical protein|tara:strand:+ start:146 stop:724 length:579 start_codon:yes stop_codon:yes gene_type:complete
MIKQHLAKITIFAITALSPLVMANDFADIITEHANADVKEWLADPAIINAIKAQNTTSTALTQAEIDALDKQWRSEVSSTDKAMINAVLNNALSGYLQGKLAASNGLYTEIFVMDNKGLNVGQSNITSDYWQGDEAKWQDTFMQGANSIHISEVEEDESTQTYQSQLSLPVIDPSSQAVIGAITIGINVDAL